MPPGWSEWYGSLDDPDNFTGGTYTMYGYTLNENGADRPLRLDPRRRRSRHLPDRRLLAEGRGLHPPPGAEATSPSTSRSRRWRPHGEAASCNCAGDNPRAAPRHQGRFAAEPAPRPPSFNEADVSDKPADIRNLTPITAPQEAASTPATAPASRRCSRSTTWSATWSAPSRQKGELKNTVFIFTSDNGFFHGEHRVRSGKVRHYEESSGVPLIIRGPGVPKDKHRAQLAANVDLAPTILDFANAKLGSRRWTDARWCR